MSDVSWHLFSTSMIERYVLLDHVAVDLVYLSAYWMSFLDTSSHCICKYSRLKIIHPIWTQEYICNKITEYKSCLTLNLI